MRIRNIYRDKLFKIHFLSTYYLFPLLLFLTTIFFYCSAEGRYVLLPFNYPPSPYPFIFEEVDHYQPVPLLCEKVHFVFQVPAMGAAELHLAVSHNNEFVKKVALKTSTYHQGHYYFHFSLQLDIGENKVELTLTDEIGHALKYIDFYYVSKTFYSYRDYPNKLPTL